VSGGGAPPCQCPSACTAAAPHLDRLGSPLRLGHCCLFLWHSGGGALVAVGSGMRRERGPRLRAGILVWPETATTVLHRRKVAGRLGPAGIFFAANFLQAPGRTATSFAPVKPHTDHSKVRRQRGSGCRGGLCGGAKVGRWRRQQRSPVKRAQAKGRGAVLARHLMAQAQSGVFGMHPWAHADWQCAR
jgi:hypothetical protein